MKDLFSDLLQRSRGEAGLSPALPSRFEVVTAPVEPWGEVEYVMPARARVARPAEPPAEWLLGDRGRAGEPVAKASPESPGRLDRFADDADRSAPARSGERPQEARPRSGPPVEPPTPLDLAAMIAAALRQRERGPADTRSPDTAESAAAPSRRDDAGAPHAIARPIAAIAAPLRPAAPTAPSATPATPPAIDVRIGRIEVTAAIPPTPRPAPAPRVARSHAVALSLRDYLARRGRR